ncbi:hypothetical protein [Dietzia lutea]|uniref:Uncharacterized protein n=1 Tax=Dietzia lutea TaxID=546160 RepID=A0A2S1RCF0_9ACTN|nr:hypothetical protein [Dietzia lutea]AWH93973.1 hypothetical protein A6035_12765 [Dietzia lutea]
MCPARRRFNLALAIAAASTVLGSAAAGAAPADAAPAAPAPATRGLPGSVTDVLGPADPAFWDAAVPGTRIATPVDPRDEVICLTGFVPKLNCWTKERDVLAATMRPLAHVDIPMIGGPPLRIWVDLPRWGDGSTGEEPISEWTTDAILWWLYGRSPS